MVQAAAAAYEMVGPEFCIDSLQAHFLFGPDPKLPMLYKVGRLSDGGRFLTRTVTAEQNGKAMMHVTCTFVRSSAMNGPSMTHSVQRQGKRTIDSITLDDLDLARNEYGPYMKFQRLPLESIGSNSSSTARLYTSAAHITPSVDSSSTRLHALGIIALSDYHVLDAPPTLHGLTFGLPRINDTARASTEQSFRMYTSLNHNIHFRMHEGFRADDMCYIEVTNPWAERRRAEVQSRIFDTEGRLIASCVQEAYYVLKDETERGKL